MSALADRLQARIDDLEDQVRVLREALAAECAPLAPLGLTPQQEAVMAALMRSERVTGVSMMAACESHRRHETIVTRDYPRIIVIHLRRRLARHGVDIETVHGSGYRLTRAAKARVREICAGVPA